MRGIHGSDTSARTYSIQGRSPAAAPGALPSGDALPSTVTPGPAAPSPSASLPPTTTPPSLAIIRHGLGFIDTPQINTNRSIYFSKYIKLQQLMETTSQGWYWMVDLDTIITNPPFDVRILLRGPTHTGPEMLVSNDMNELNAGSFFEQAGLISLYRTAPRLRKRVWLIPQWWHNSYTPGSAFNLKSTDDPPRNKQPGDFMIHFAGHSHKLSDMGNWRKHYRMRFNVG
ncbi:hypothetical protein CXG81DRAFT_28778 [Caulochytrium protostelioides]|uniref:Nucleotide-diphospho-sugar transferase domain-containing protein n=1 Tax=Caulochytrium protostelioides TaxID=1555241 RepID=A0A4V1ITV6_9FUNG|nr:hypothetical protein CXG81DRAFT_28778 [Caulochytrium protostelioides]|eukprot:RKO98387.1 hypothetical protein CXG81DRAFT_28778 [Caulochytrium protostelioides]